MGLIMNASAELQKFVVFGNHFEMKPNQIKMFTDQMSHYISLERAYLGLVSLPESFEDPQHLTTEEGKAQLAELKANGIKNRIRHLKEIVYNNQVSMRQDLERANIKAAPEVFASDGELAAMEELSTYQNLEEDKARARADRFNELKTKLDKKAKKEA